MKATQSAAFPDIQEEKKKMRVIRISGVTSGAPGFNPDIHFTPIGMETIEIRELEKFSGDDSQLEENRCSHPNEARSRIHDARIKFLEENNSREDVEEYSQAIYSSTEPDLDSLFYKMSITSHDTFFAGYTGTPKKSGSPRIRSQQQGERSKLQRQAANHERAAVQDKPKTSPKKYEKARSKMLTAERRAKADML